MYVTLNMTLYKGSGDIEAVYPICSNFKFLYSIVPFFLHGCLTALKFAARRVETIFHLD